MVPEMILKIKVSCSFTDADVPPAGPGSAADTPREEQQPRIQHSHQISSTRVAGICAQAACSARDESAETAGQSYDSLQQPCSFLL